MRIIGIITNYKNKLQTNDFTNKTWDHLSYKNNEIYLNIFSKKEENVRIINNDSILLLSDDNFVFEKNDKVVKLYDIEDIIKQEGIDFIKRNQPNINVFFYDKKKNEIYLASNRATAGRIYYFFNGDDFFFSNDFALLANMKEFKLNDIGLYAYLKYGAVPEDITFDNQIKSVPVGHYVKVDYHNKDVEYIAYYKFNYIDSDKNGEELLSLTESTLKSIAKEYSDQQIHMLISGGIDSTLFAFYLKEYSTQIIGHYCRFGEKDSEQKYAEQAAKELNIPLELHTLDDNKIIAEIEDTAKNTSYVHADFSNISVNFLLREIHEKYGDNAIIIECNGADDGFGYGGVLKIPVWEKLYKLPNVLLKIIANIFNFSNTWMLDSFLTRRFFYFYRAIEKNIYNSYMISSVSNKIFKKKTNKYDKLLLKLINHFFNNNLEKQNSSMYEKMNVAQFLHVNSRLWTAKGYSPAQNLKIKIIYPFTWEKILNLQSVIPLNIKIHNGEVKWPLKKLLENYMPNKFIYRDKSGFAPPIKRWLQNTNNFSYFYDNIVNGISMDFIKKEKIEIIFDKIKRGKNLSRYAINLIWSLLFFEIWNKQNINIRKENNIFDYLE